MSALLHQRVAMSGKAYLAVICVGPAALPYGCG